MLADFLYMPRRRKKAAANGGGIYVNKDIVRWQEETLTTDSRPIVDFKRL